MVKSVGNQKMAKDCTPGILYMEKLKFLMFVVEI